MSRHIVLLICLMFASQASAQNCPDFFRFVDFGLQDADGNFLRGGPLLRAESLEGSPLLKRSETQCRKVSDLATDGHANPIPVVTGISYDPDRIPVELLDLRVSFAQDTRSEAAKNAAIHLDGSSSLETSLIKGEQSLCKLSHGLRSLSCQVFSPYPGNGELIIYCDHEQCRMPVLAVTQTIQVSAIWPPSKTFWDNPDEAGNEILGKVQDIVAFLEPLASGI